MPEANSHDQMSKPELGVGAATARPVAPQGRILLPLSDWPEADRAAWRALFFVGDIFEEPSRGCHWASRTRRSYHQHYARWLGWLMNADLLDPETAPGERVTQDRIARYLRHLGGSLAPCTVASAIIGLKVVLRAMEPRRDWRWLMDLSNRLNMTAKPSIDRRPRMRPVTDVLGAARVELDRLLNTPLRRRVDRVGYRDTLAVLLLAACPVRLKNLTAIEIGRHLTRETGRWVLRFVASETKTKRPITLDVPCEVAPYLELYLTRVRPSLGPAPSCQHLWLTFEGVPLSAHSLGLRISGKTKRLLGVAINPHLFRSIAATSLVEQAPEYWQAAAPLLGHMTLKMTQRAYLRPDPLAASRKTNTLLARLRDRKR